MSLCKWSLHKIPYEMQSKIHFEVIMGFSLQCLFLENNIQMSTAIGNVQR